MNSGLPFQIVIFKALFHYLFVLDPFYDNPLLEIFYFRKCFFTKILTYFLDAELGSLIVFGC